MELVLNDGYAIYGPKNEIEGSVLFSFDLDHTIIKPRNSTFYKCIDDWEFVKGMDQKLKHLYSLRGNSAIVVFTNQGGVVAGKVTVDEIVARLDAVMEKLGFQFLTFIALSNQYRKPSPALFEKLIISYMSGFKSGFYIGDASSIDDFSDSDYRFALNTGLKYIDVRQFQNIPDVPSAGANVPSADSVPGSDAPSTDGIPSTDGTYDAPSTGVNVPITGVDRAYIDTLDKLCLRVQLQNVPVRNYITRDAVFEYPGQDYNNGALVLLVGPPGCGKSSYAATSGWTVISRDTVSRGKHATAAQCLSAVKKMISCKIALKEKPFIIMDATHPDVKSREAFIKLASSMGMASIAVVFDVAIDVAKYINKIRCINGGSYVPEIAYGVFSKRYSVPTAEEGFVRVIIIKQIPQNYNVMPDRYLDLYL